MNFDAAFNLYAMEQEGLLDTREAKIQNFIRIAAARLREWGDAGSWHQIATAAGFSSIYDLTDAELTRIEREIEERL